MKSNVVAEKLAKVALEIQAIKLSPQNPFTWTSGFRMPVYNDNRLLLSRYEYRALVAQGFQEIFLSQKISCSVIAGTATAGIAPATTFADLLQLPLVYVREKPKGHGLKKRVEGIMNPGDRVLLVEDLISTAKSSVSAVEGIHEEGGVVEHVLSIFSYGFPEAREALAKLGCTLHSLLTFPTLLEVAARESYITAQEVELLRSWSEKPFEWGERNGFPRVVSA